MAGHTNPKSGSPHHCALLRKVINGEPLQAEFHPDPSAGRFYRFVFRYRVDPSLALAEDTSIVAGPSNAPWQPNAVSEEDPKKDTVGNNNEINAKGKPVNPRVNTASETEPRHTFNEHQYTTAVTSEPAAEADPIRAAAEPVNEDPFTYHVKIEARTP
ncbi:uncharacterized protein I303_102930 [Kwoniella dejecticola CBS 10117]|uniref:Uncharacterized protein n=1 Tax=Kwoniella dejecticola CBS 10117 TaxID=1296121 RepID=A0A1A6AA46_9TREE|nr:uncharacterized protein I303_02950 [Kwoniella dejecticola CBS 10117]OBR86929.1 hypothetical protein I303_02950 [Kwoniella dejecticola CBS 10117]